LGGVVVKKYRIEDAAALKRFTPFAIFLTVTLASFLAAGYAYYAADEAGRIKFDAAADDAVGRIMVRLEQPFSLLYATLAFFTARDGDVSRPAFRTFVRTLDLETRLPGLQGIGFAGFIRKGDEAIIERYLEQEYDATLPVWPSETDQGWRAPIALLEPLVEANHRAIGFDMFSDPVRRAAMIDAMNAREPRASGPVRLVQEGASEAQQGFIVYLPFPLGEQAYGNTAAPFSATQGFIYSSIRAGDLLRAVLGRAPLIPVSVAIYDREVDPARLLFRSQLPPAEQFGEAFVVERELTVAGRAWIARFQPTADFEAPSRAIPLAIALFGLLLAVALALGARARERAYDAVTQLHQASEKSLIEKDLMLQEMKHRIKNSIARVLAIARQTAAGATSMEEFSDSFNARLQAMAASQDMLTRSRWQKADLEQLLRIELDQVFGQGKGRQELSGPPVQLDEAATQALGLTFHELATNALKYGEVGDNGSSLTVRWRVKGGRSADRLVLIWSETSSEKVAPPEKKGFGTRLIDTNITRELNGRIERRYGGRGLEIEIEIPLA
jgi:CHASE1-domain containing sensor protein